MIQLLSLLLFCSTVFAAIEQRNVQVQGNCELKVEPDQGRITYSAENQAKDQKIAVNKTNEQINQLKEKIRAMKLEHLELKNTNYSVYPVREYGKDRYVSKGVRASLSLEVTTSNITRMGEVMVAASQIGLQLELNDYRKSSSL